jgi:hypothetical protein
MRQILIGATMLALLMAGCGDSGDPGPSGESDLTKLARGVEAEVEVENTRCHPVRGGDGKHFYCLVNAGGGSEFRLGVAVVGGKRRPVITSCEDAREKRPNVLSVCALPWAGS